MRLLMPVQLLRLELQADFETFWKKLEKHFNTEEIHLQSGTWGHGGVG